MPSQKWQDVRGDDLVEHFDSGSIAELLPERSAVYIWKRNLRYRGSESATAEDLTAWIAQQVRTPNGRILSKQISHFARIPEFELRPKDLDPKRRKVFTNWFLRNPGNKRMMERYMSGLAAHLPALYVGETGNLPKRIRQHLNEDTQFDKTVAFDSDLSWLDLDLFYLDLGDPSDNESQIRQAIELVTTAVTIGGFTRRAG